MKLSTTSWHLPWALSTSARIKPRAAAAAGLQHPREELRVEKRNEALCALGKTGTNNLSRILESAVPAEKDRCLC